LVEGVKNVAVLDPILYCGASNWRAISLTDSAERPARLKELAGTAVALVLGC
jgi:hypothetical protein